MICTTSFDGVFAPPVDEYLVRSSGSSPNFAVNIRGRCELKKAETPLPFNKLFCRVCSERKAASPKKSSSVEQTFFPFFIEAFPNTPENRKENNWWPALYHEKKRLQVPHCRKRSPETSSGSRIDDVIADIDKLPFSEHIQAKRVSSVHCH